jgi:hypothetical protein
MKTAFYSKIRCAVGQTEAQVIQKAKTLGYTLTKFNGWDDDDLGFAGNRGPRWIEARENMAILKEIMDACVVKIDARTFDYPHIRDVAIANL